MDIELLKNFLVLLVDEVPIYLVWVIGIVISIAQRKKHPQVSLLTSISLIIFMIAVTV